MKTKAFITRILICLVLSLIPAQEIENSIFSTRMQLRNQWTQAKNIQLVEVKTNSQSPLQSFEEVIPQILKSNPSVIVIPWFIDNKKSLESSTSFLNHPKVIWSSFNEPLHISKPSLVTSRFRFKPFFQDSDGTVRRFKINSSNQDSLALQALFLKKFKIIEDLEIKKENWINFIGPPGTFDQCTIESTSNITKNCPHLENKIIVLSRENLNSFWNTTLPTPIGEMKPSEILANEIYTIIEKKTLYYIPEFAHIFILMAVILFCAYFIIYYPVIISSTVIFSLGIFSITFVFQIFFHYFHIYIPIVNFTIATIVSYLIFTGYRLAFQETLQWRNLKSFQQSKEIDLMKSNFISLVSHDLKTPIAKIQTAAQALKKEQQDQENPSALIKKYISSIENNTLELKSYITSILNLSRIESQKVTLNKSSNDINKIIENCLKRMRSLAQQKNIIFETKFEPLFSIECDEHLIQQVLTNLVDNAIRYSPVDSKIILSTTEDNDFIHVSIEDFGPGIPKEQIPLMFRKFGRVQQTKLGSPKGTGLGLYLSQYFINLHGGNIQFKTKENSGTTFTFLLPVTNS